MSPFHLLIIADDPLARSGLISLLADYPEVHVKAQAAAVIIDDYLGYDEFEAIIWDVGWNTEKSPPDWSDIDIPIIALLADETDILGAWGAGARALLNRHVDGDRLMAAVNAAVQGLITFDPNLAGHILPHSTADTPPTAELTPRELDVLQLLAEGMTNKGIAHRLAISDHTVKFHVNAIMSKLAAQSRTEAVVLATRKGLIVL